MQTGSSRHNMHGGCVLQGGAPVPPADPCLGAAPAFHIALSAYSLAGRMGRSQLLRYVTCAVAKGIMCSRTR